MDLSLTNYEDFFDRYGFLWILNETCLEKKNLSNRTISFCLNNYAYDSTKEGFLGEGSFFRAYKARKLFSLSGDLTGDIWRTLRVGLISCLRRNKVVLNNGERKIILSIYERIILECLMMSRLNHKNIAKAFGVIEVPEYNQIISIQEYLPNQLMYWNETYGSYNAKKNSKKHFVYNEKTSLRIFDQLLSSIEYLHNLNIIHRDIKPENIFLTKEFKDKDMVLISEIDSYSDSEYDFDSLTSDDDYFDEKCIWSDSPIFNSVLAGAEEYRNHRELNFKNYNNFDDFLLDSGISKIFSELIQIEGYRRLFEDRELMLESNFKVKDSETIVKISDFNSSIIVEDDSLIFDSGKLLLVIRFF